MSDDSYIGAAFDEICDAAKEAKGSYVVLMENIPFYGGPEEGGWWGSDTRVVKYQWFETEEATQVAYDKVVELAKELQQQAQRQYGEQCLRETEWLEARNLDDSFLREPDGPSEYYVVMSDTIPQGRRGCRHYE